MINFFKNFFKAKEPFFINLENMNLIELIQLLNTKTLPLASGNRVILKALKEINKRLIELEKTKID
jgi:hypothetical protein